MTPFVLSHTFPRLFCAAVHKSAVHCGVLLFINARCIVGSTVNKRAMHCGVLLFNNAQCIVVGNYYILGQRSFL